MRLALYLEGPACGPDSSTFFLHELGQGQRVKTGPGSGRAQRKIAWNGAAIGTESGDDESTVPVLSVAIKKAVSGD